MRRQASLAVATGSLLLLLGGPQARAVADDAPVLNRRTGLHELAIARLEAAVGRGDRAEIARLADRIGPARLGAALGQGEPKSTVALFDGVDAMTGNLRLLERAVHFVDAPTPEIAARAARTVGRMLAGDDPGDLETWDVPPDAVSSACRALSSAATTGSTVAVRQEALEALGAARPFCAADPALAAAFADPAAELRRAAVLALPDRQGAFAREVGARLTDPVPRVAAAAGAILCARRLEGPPTSPTSRAPARPPARGAPSVSSPGSTPGGKQPTPVAFRTLVMSGETPVEDAVEMLPCLQRSADPADRRAFEEVREGRASPLRERARQLAEEARSGR
jgi:hypothetical protein